MRNLDIVHVCRIYIFETNYGRFQLELEYSKVAGPFNSANPSD